MLKMNDKGIMSVHTRENKSCMRHVVHMGCDATMDY